jgi:hypothetical protein
VRPSGLRWLRRAHPQTHSERLDDLCGGGGGELRVLGVAGAAGRRLSTGHLETATA